MATNRNSCSTTSTTAGSRWRLAWGPTGHLNVAISETADPTGFWGIYDFDLGSNRFAEAPVAGPVHQQGRDRFRRRDLVSGLRREQPSRDRYGVDPRRPERDHVPGDDARSRSDVVARRRRPDGRRDAPCGRHHAAHPERRPTSSTCPRRAPLAGGLTFAVEDLSTRRLRTSTTGMYLIGAGFYLPAGPLGRRLAERQALVRLEPRLHPVRARRARSRACAPPKSRLGATTGLVQDFRIRLRIQQRAGRDRWRRPRCLTDTRGRDGPVRRRPAGVRMAGRTRSMPGRWRPCPPTRHAPVWSPTMPLARDPRRSRRRLGRRRPPEGQRLDDMGLQAGDRGRRPERSARDRRRPGPHEQPPICGRQQRCGASDDTTQMLVSNRAQVQNGKLQLSKSYAVSDEIWWSLANRGDWRKRDDRATDDLCPVGRR